MADEIEGVRSAAWHALCAALTRYGYVEPDDLPGLPLADAFVEAFAERGYALTESGRLLPPGGEVSTQWGRRRKRKNTDMWTPVFDEDRTRDEALAGIGRWLRTYRQPCQLMRRQVTEWRGTDSVIFGAWEVVEDVPVVSDNSEGESSG